MSDTIVDHAKITQMLDAGWEVFICKGDCGTYCVDAEHPNPAVMKRAKDRIIEAIMAKGDTGYKFAELCAEMNAYAYTPQQALTRMAYKVHGEII